MTTKFFQAGAASLILLAAISSCKKIEMGADSKPDYSTDQNAAPLKDATDMPIGVAVSYNGMMTNSAYEGVVKRDFDQVTFENEMKHYSIVQNDGSLDYTKADALVAKVGALDIHGHTLGWHQNQNAGYLKTFAGIVVAAAAELYTNNGGFESGLTGWSVFNTGNPSGSATITATSVGSEVRTGTGAMKVVNPTAYAGNQWRVQVSSSNITLSTTKQYTISYWVKAANAGGSIRLSSGPSSAQYQGDQTIGTSWQQVSWTITPTVSPFTFLFDMGQAANTYFIDDVSVKEVVPAPSGGQIATKLDQALGNFVTNTVTRYKGKVKSWDVINELFADNGDIRTNSNTATTASDVLVWSNYLGRDYAFKAFQYAAAADPAATLYINDYNLESSAAKVDSLIKYVAEIKARGAKVDGIGTQMHISWNTSYTGIVSMFQKLAATGLKVKVTELDVKTNTNSLASYTLSPEFAAFQADMYNFVVKSYLKYVPANQRGGISVWGVSDNLSWLYNSGKEYPLLYDASFNRKPAYTGFLKGLKGE